MTIKESTPKYTEEAGSKTRDTVDNHSRNKTAEESKANLVDIEGVVPKITKELRAKTNEAVDNHSRNKTVEESEVNTGEIKELVPKNTDQVSAKISETVDNHSVKESEVNKGETKDVLPKNMEELSAKTSESVDNHCRNKTAEESEENKGEVKELVSKNMNQVSAKISETVENHSVKEYEVNKGNTKDVLLKNMEELSAKTSETVDNHSKNKTLEESEANKDEIKAPTPKNAEQVNEVSKTIVRADNQKANFTSDKITYIEFKYGKDGPLKARIEEILDKQCKAHYKIYKFNKNLLKHIKQRSENSPQVIQNQGIVSLNKTLLDPRVLDVYEMQKTLYKYLATELRKPYYERCTRYSLSEKYNACNYSSDKDERFLHEQAKEPPKEILKGTYYIEKVPPNRYEVEKTEPPPPPVVRTCDKLCLPLKNISEVALKPSIEETTTLNKQQIDKIQVVPKTEENALDKYKGFKITQFNIRHRRRSEENFLPIVFGLNKNDARALQSRTTYEEAKRQIMEFRYELLRKLHKEFSALCQRDMNRNVGKFDRVSKYYKSVTEKLKKRNEEEIVVKNQPMSIEELLGPCPKPSFENVSRYYKWMIVKGKGDAKKELCYNEKKDVDANDVASSGTKDLIQRLSEKTTELDRGRNELKETEHVLAKSGKKDDEKGNDPPNSPN